MFRVHGQDTEIQFEICALQKVTFMLLNEGKFELTIVDYPKSQLLILNAEMNVYSCIMCVRHQKIELQNRIMKLY